MGLGDIIVKWQIRGVAKTQYRLFKITKKKKPELSEEEIAPQIFIRRMGRIVSSESQQFRINTYFEVNPPIRTLREACHAIAVVEHKIHPEDYGNVLFLETIINKELDRLGYSEE